MFVAMKVAEILAQPINLVLLALLGTALLLWQGRQRAARHLLTGTSVILGLLAIAPLGEWLLAPLENRFPAPSALPGMVDGIVVLGGAVEPELSAARGQPALNGAAERLTVMIALARSHPDARLIYTGGSGSITRQELKEAPPTRDLLAAMGVDVARVAFEDQSRNTWENAIFSRATARPEAGQTWLLVTSARHMPRSVGAFRAAGWNVVPYPVDYLTSGSGTHLWLDAGHNVRMLSHAMHEWAGLVYYRLRGWSDSWYPGL